LHRICVAMTCKNAALTIRHSLLSASKQTGVNLSVVIVDSNSTDGTDSVAIETLKAFNIPYKLIRKGCNIAEGRNIALKAALDFDPEYVFLLDSDTLLLYSNALETAANCSRGRLVVHLPSQFVYLSTDELDGFCENVVRSMRMLDSADVEKAKWCGLGATLIPSKLAEKVELDPSLSFAEDRQFGFLAWKHGYPVVLLKGVLALDVNIKGKKGDIYIKMPVREYWRGITKKILWQNVWNYFQGSLIPTLKSFLSGYYTKKRHIPHAIVDALAICLLLSGVPFILILAGAAGALLWWGLRKGMSITEIPRQFIKFNFYALAVLALFIPLYIKHYKELHEVYLAYLNYGEELPDRRSCCKIGCY